MDVFNKVISQVSSSVHSTVSQLSGVLPGNPVTREYESCGHIASAGPGLLWKIYKGNKRSTKQEASIFVFDKRQLDKYNKNDKELILDTLRKGIIRLTKIRHPKVLIIQHPLEESRDSLAFAAEPIFASLANVLGQTINMPQPTNMSDYKLYDIEIKYGLLQIGEGLAFLHSDVKLLHKNIIPENIVINAVGAWKIFGFDFSVSNSNPGNIPPTYSFEEYSPSIPSICQPSLDFLAPECVINSSHSPASDLFSLGMLAYVVISPNKKPFRPLKSYSQFKERVLALSRLNTEDLKFIPNDLRENVINLLKPDPKMRMDIHQFIKISYFDDVCIKTLTYLDSLLQWDNLQKSQFYKGLPKALSKLPHKVKIQRVLSYLAHDLAQPQMVPFILPSIFDIAQGSTKEEYCLYVLPLIKPLMHLLEPVQVLLFFLQKMELLLKLTPAEDIQQHVLPMLYRGLDSDSPQIHELCLAVLPTFAGLLDHSNVKNGLLPRIKKLCLNTSTLSVRVNCLLCIGRLLEHLDKWLVLDEVLPLLPQIPSREPAVLMGIIGVYKLALDHKKLGITKEIIATRVLPFLIPLCIENGLSIQQFEAITTLVKDMFRLVENEHRTKLKQLNGVRDEQIMLANSIPDVTPKMQPVQNTVDFEDLFKELDVTTPPTLKTEQKSVNNNQSQLNVECQKANHLFDDLLRTPSKSISNESNFIKIQHNNYNNNSGKNSTNWNSFKAPNYSSSSNFMNNNSSVFDNLLLDNSIVNVNKSFGQIGQQMPLIPINSTSNSNIVNAVNKGLTKDDILDFLS